MSHSNRHQFMALNNNTKPLSGQRIARVIAKADKSGNYNPNLTQSLAISIPPIAISEVKANIELLAPHIAGYLESIQDAIISERRKVSGTNEIGDEEISIAAIAAFLESDAKGSRITSEALAIWFSESYSLAAAEFVALALSFPAEMENWSDAQTDVIEKKVSILSGMFSSFASGKFSPDIPKCKAIIKFGKFVEDAADSRMKGYVAKAERILEEKTKELSIDALGF